MVTQFDPLDHLDCKKLEILKTQGGGGRHFEKSKKSPVWLIDIVLTLFIYLKTANIIKENWN